ncbi:GNAT family N-acetyltransferase [Indioceanicola profundi]|uniref:GNAT family N-acetyltransferase n=1 Tax=Indioceanicola profundi TaxID=2220096 RepID=UPI000E6AC098|nr:GNAT family protein [Indioceanicola profundi]
MPIRIFQTGLLSPPAIRVEGEGVFIRPAQAKDWEEWAALREISRDFLVPWEPTWPADALTRTAFQRRVRRQAVEWREDEAYSFLTFERRSGRLVGGIGLSNVRRGVAQMGTMGYWVGKPFARRGYTTESAKLLLNFAFGQLGLHRVEAACLPTNIPSQGVLEKAGFTREGYARGYLRIDGRWADHVLYAVLKDDLVG